MVSIQGPGPNQQIKSHEICHFLVRWLGHDPDYPSNGSLSGPEQSTTDFSLPPGKL
jgi:hypothetical protein